MPTSVLLTDIVNERHQHREKLLALIAICSFAGWSLKETSSFDYDIFCTRTAVKYVPDVNPDVLRAVLFTFTTTSPKWEQELAIRGFKSCWCWKMSIFECIAAQKRFQWGRIQNISGEISRQIKAIKRRAVIFHKEQHQALFKKYFFGYEFVLMTISDLMYRLTVETQKRGGGSSGADVLILDPCSKSDML